jgi:hypothetical protein
MAFWRIGRIAAALAAVACSSVLVAPGTPAGAAREDHQPSHLTIDGTLAPGEVAYLPASCGGGLGAYVERGSDQTVPKVKMIVESPIIAGPIVATTTVPNQFGSRAVTGMRIFVGNPGFVETREYHVTYWCTPDIGKAWLVFG